MKLLKTIFLSFLFIFVVFFSSCCSKNKKEINEDEFPVKIDFESIIDRKIDISLSEIVKNIEYIPLETTNECLIGDFPGIILTDDYILVNSYGGPGGKTNIFLFTRDGGFIRKIGSQGEGPKEYAYVADIEFGLDNREIYVLDDKSVVIYSVDGEFIRKFPAHGRALNIVNFKNDQLLVYTYFPLLFGSNNIQFYLIDTKGNLIWGFPVDNTKSITNRTTGKIRVSMLSTNKYTDFTNSIRDTIYRLFEENLYESIYYLYFGKYQRPENFSRKTDNYRRAVSDYIQIEGYQMAENYIFYVYRLHNEGWAAIFDKQDNIFVYNQIINLNKFHTIGLNNKLEGMIGLFWPSNVCQSGKSFLWSLSAPEIIEIIVDKEFDNNKILPLENKKRLFELANILKEDDNPVIQVYHIN